MTAKDLSMEKDAEDAAPVSSGGPNPVDSGVRSDALQGRELSQWRKAERARLIGARLALTSAERAAHAKLVVRDLNAIIPRSAGTIVSVYWPFRGEPDLRSLITELCDAGLGVALPVVVEKGKPLVFRDWTPGAPLEKGVWNIPIPANGAEVTPTVVIAPVVGFDPGCYRLGYGGGFFDRTLAGFAKKPLVIGVGHPIQALETIHPQSHDIPMDWIVTGLEAPRQAAHAGGAT